MAPKSEVHVTLRDVTENDLPVLFEFQRDPESARMAAFLPRDRPAFMEHWRTKILGDPAVIAKAISIGDEVVGNVVSFERFGRREVGYWIGREHWGKGLASAALRAFLKEDTVRPLAAIVAKHNRASVRVLEKCGFTVEREARGAPDGRGEEVDELHLSLRR